ncbi:MAG TPA: beta-eliminating lyase-related protein [Trebonia sp.]|nr:beta-eliminating lyase-related protein [Trebonia sp.]
MLIDDLALQVRDAAQSCAASLRGPVFRSPAQAFADLAEACRELGIEEWDSYGERGAVGRLEAELTGLFGVAAAAFFPSGVMAQQAALRVHADRAGTRRVALPDLSHLLVHEEDGPRVLHDLEVLLLTRGPEAPAARHVDALPGRVAAVLVELPLREAGCLLPTWDDLTALAQACSDRGIALHVDGARIWESQAWFGRGLPEIAAVADSLYVSFYKGLGGLAGAALLGPADFIAEARLWRRRLGGTIYRTTAEAVSALVGLRDQLPALGATVQFARDLAAALPPAVTPAPGVPHINHFQVHAAGDADAVNRRVLALIGEHRVGLPGWRPSPEPGRVTAEIVITQAALGLDPATAASLIAAAVTPALATRPRYATRVFTAAVISARAFFASAKYMLVLALTYSSLSMPA